MATIECRKLGKGQTICRVRTRRRVHRARRATFALRDDADAWAGGADRGVRLRMPVES